jgi:hypothetical protein
VECVSLLIQSPFCSGRLSRADDANVIRTLSIDDDQKAITYRTSNINIAILIN